MANRVCEYVAGGVCRAFSGLEAKRLGRSRRGWHRSTRPLRGKLLVPVPGRSVPRGTCQGVSKWACSAIFAPRCRSHVRTCRSQSVTTHVKYFDLKSFGVADPDRRTQRPPGAINLIWEGSSDFRKILASATKLGTRIDLNSASLAPYE